MTINHNLAATEGLAHDSDSAPVSATTTQIAIIGAGMTGLMTAHLLEQAFDGTGRAVEISIFEKSAGVGRLATRYKKPESHSEQQWQFDFGAQFFTAKSQAFQTYLQPWLEQRVIEPWLAQTATIFSTDSKPDIQLTGRWSSDQPRYISCPKMTSFGRSLATKLQHSKLYYKTRVAPLSSDSQANKGKQGVSDVGAKTMLRDDKGNELGAFDWVVCTAPQAQAIELLQHTDFALLNKIKAPKMLACYSLMLGWEQASSLPATLTEAQWEVLEVKAEDSAIGRIFIEQRKPGREDILPSVTIHASNQWSEAQVDEPLEDVQQRLIQAAQHILGWESATAPKLIDCHRWRYAATQQIEGDDSSPISYVDSHKQWIVTGDWCDEGRVESCFKAATTAVETIIY